MEKEKVKKQPPVGAGGIGGEKCDFLFVFLYYHIPESKIKRAAEP